MAASFVYQGSLLVVGGGRMGEAIVRGLLKAGALRASDITVAEPDASRRESLGGSLHVHCVDTAKKAVPSADVVLLAVKPQVIDSVVASLSGMVGPKQLVISIAAGVTTAKLESMFAEGTSVVRVMPNAPALVGEGMAVVSGGSAVSADQVETVRRLFAAIGEAVVLDERYQDAATAISGSGPAYFALVVDSLARAGVRHGLPREVAQKLAVRTMRGTAELLEATDLHPQEVIDSVASPGGTTIAALEAMQKAGLTSALAEGVEAAVKRAKELG